MDKKRKYRKGVDPTENQLQISVVANMRASKAYNDGWTFYAVPNDGRQGEGHRIHAWKMGQLSGVGDLYLNNPAGVSMYLELKRIDGEQADDQIAFQKHCESKGIDYQVARSLDDAMEILKQWGFPVL
ncbi:MAG: hypothetical protein GY751_11835 [Bacteroidetes bacterium]|nr:hypothetical protein [Bacteroidota bacterium]